MKKNIFIFLIIIITLFLSVIASTYAYLTSSVASTNNTIHASSISYGLDMNITPLYNDFRIIPTDDEDISKAILNECKDKYDRGSCNAYKINISGYDDKQQTISGVLTATLNNIENLSFIMLEKREIDTDGECIDINEEKYCKTTNPTLITENEELSLGNNYDITNTTEKDFLLVIWLKNLEESQNEFDLGDYNMSITFSVGNGGKISGNIAASINAELQSSTGG